MQIRRVEDLESHFKQFPDVPREVIVKSDVLLWGVRFSEAALEAGKDCREKSYHLFTYDKATYDQLGRKEPFRAPAELAIRGGPYGLRRMIVNVRLNPDSPYLVDVSDGQLAVFGDGTPIGEVAYPLRPEYYSKSFPDGTKYWELVSITSDGCQVFSTVFPSCQFWGEKEECKFCDINENFRQGKKHGKFSLPTAYKPVEQVAEVMEEIFLREKEPGGVRPLAILLTGGAITGKLAGKKEDDFYLRYIEAIKDRIGNRWPLIFQSVAKDKETLKRYRAAGVDCHHADIEVWDKNLFKVICPGKDKYIGRDEWIKRVVESVDVFGEGNVTPGMVAGVEMAQPYGFEDVASAVKSTTEGFEFLMSHGVILRYNQWNVSPLSALAGNKPPPLEYYIRLAQAWCETWTKYNLPPVRGFGPMGPGRALIWHSALYDMDPVKCAQ